MAGPSRMNSVPKPMVPIYEKVVGLTDDVCKRQLNSEYRDLARAMARSPRTRQMVEACAGLVSQTERVPTTIIWTDS